MNYVDKLRQTHTADSDAIWKKLKEFDIQMKIFNADLAVLRRLIKDVKTANEHCAN